MNGRMLVLCGMSFIVVACASAHRGPELAPQQHAVDAFIRAWNAHDFDALDSLVTPDFVHEDIGAGWRGKSLADAKWYMRAALTNIPDFHWVPKLWTVQDSVVTLEWTLDGTVKPDSASPPGRFAIPGASVAVVRGGRLARFSDYYNWQAAQRQARRPPAP
jgi:steroid delta-isomerase-like uncharacterized protein